MVFLCYYYKDLLEGFLFSISRFSAMLLKTTNKTHSQCDTE